MRSSNIVFVRLFPAAEAASRRKEQPIPDPRCDGLKAAIAIGMCIPQICLQWYLYPAHPSLYKLSSRSNVTCIAGSECCIDSQHWHFIRQSAFFLKDSNWASAMCWKGITAQTRPAAMRPFLTRVQGQVAFRWLGSCIYFSACSAIYVGASWCRLEVDASACTCAPVNCFAAMFLTLLHVLLALLHATFYLLAAFGDPGTVIADMHDVNTPCDWKHCETCNLARPFRAKHCPEPGCNRCVSRFDHFCGFIGAAVGAGNEVSFMAMCLFVFLDCSLSCLNCAWVLISPSDGRADAPGLLAILQSGRLLSMVTVNSLWQRVFCVRARVAHEAALVLFKCILSAHA
jgi:hypothetical protein